MVNVIWQVTFQGKLLSPNVICHWSKRVSLKKKHERLVLAQYHADKPTLTLPAQIELCRIAPRSFDDDNLCACFKSLRDTIAQLYFPDKARGQADNTNQLTWKYSQRKGKPKEYLIQVTITCQ